MMKNFGYSSLQIAYQEEKYKIYEIYEVLQAKIENFNKKGLRPRVRRDKVEGYESGEDKLRGGRQKIYFEVSLRKKLLPTL